MKKKTLAKRIEEVAKLAQLYSKISRADVNGLVTCVSCGAVGHYKNFDGGHFVSRAYKSTIFEPTNIHPQCKRCNGFLNGNILSYIEYLKKTYGQEEVDRLLALRHQLKKRTDEELDKLKEDYKEKIKKELLRLAK